MSNPIDALTKAKVDPSFLEKIKGYLNNPMAPFLLPILGIDKKTALQKIDELEKMKNDTNTSFSNSSQPSSVSKSFADDLERFRKGLNSF